MIFLRLRNPLTKKLNLFPIIFAIAAVLAIAFLITGQLRLKNQLEVYHESNRIQTDRTTEEKKKEIHMIAYDNEKLGYKIAIPSDWKKIQSEKSTKFIHEGSESSLELIELQYDPIINNLNEETASEDVTEQGMNFVEYKRIDNSSYQLIYQKTQEDAVYDYIEKVYWDRKHILKMISICKDKYYNKMETYYEKIYGTFQWNKEDPIPDDCYLIYNANTKCEFAIPQDWTTQTADNTMIAINQDSTATETLSITAAEKLNLESVKSNEMANWLGNGKDYFILSSYERTKKKAKVCYSYTKDNQQVRGESYLWKKNNLLYKLEFEWMDNGEIENKEELIQLMRFF